MSWTKAELVDQAFATCAMATYVFDPSVEERVSAGVALDAMMAFLSSHRGIQVGFNLATSPAAFNLDVDSGIPLSACEPVYSMLALRICSMQGKTPSMELKQRAADGYSALQVKTTTAQPMQGRAGVPRGAGHRRSTRQPFFPQPTPDTLPMTPGGELDFLGG